VKLIDVPTSDAGYLESHAMGLLTFGLNVTLDGCIDHTQGIVDDELHDYWTQLMDQSGAMLFGRNTYELMEGAWPAVARDEKAPRAMREWAQKLEAKAKYVVSGSRSDFPWQNTIKVEGDLCEAISALKAKTERGVLVGAPPSSRLRSRSWGSSTSTVSSFIPSSVAAGRRCFMACRVRGVSSSYRRSGSSPACRRSTSVAKRDERGRRVVQLHPLAPLQVPEQHSTPDEQGADTSPTQIDLVPVHPHKTSYDPP
jgi:hypothetical protein